MKVPVNSSSITNKLSLALALWLGLTAIAGLSGCSKHRSSDPAPTVSVSAASVDEGNSGTTNLVFTLTASSAINAAITVTYETTADTATAITDYTETSGSIVIPAGSTSATITVPVIGEEVYEGDETLTLTLKAATGATLGSVTATGTILNDDNEPSVSIADASVAEGNSGTTDLVFAINASNASDSLITLTYATSDGSAHAADNDYTVTIASVDIQPGNTNATIRIPVIADKVFEPDETFTLTLSSPTGATLGTASATGTILNDDERFITRISVNANGEGGNSTSEYPVISADGRYVAFASQSSNLVNDDTNNAKDIFVKDTQTNSITRVSVDSTGTEGDGASREPSISGDGRYVVFTSAATNLVSDDTNSVEDVFLHDLVSGKTQRLSVATDGTAGDAQSRTASISSDGGYVVFVSGATTLVSDDTNDFYDIFVRDIANNTTARASVSSNGDQGDAHSSSQYPPAISEGGQYVFFSTVATNLVDNDTNSSSDVFVRDMTNGTTTRVSIASGTNGAEGNGPSASPSISDDGKYVVFVSAANNFVSDDTNNFPDIFLRDTVVGTTTRISIDSSGLESNQSSFRPSLSNDARYIAFVSQSTNLVADDTNTFTDIFVHDRQAGETFRISVNASGEEGDDRSGVPYIPIVSSDGKYVVFESDASNLVSDDIDMQTDIFRVLISAAP